MKNTFLKLMVVTVIAVMGLMVITPALAADQPTSPSSQLKDFQKADSGIETGKSVGEYTANIIRWILGIIGVILIAMFVYGGVMYATSAGSDERVETGKKVMIYAIIGTAIVAIAFIASDYVVSALFPSTSSK